MFAYGTASERARVVVDAAGVPPKPPYRPPAEGHRPYHVGYVDLGEVLVEALLEVSRAEIGSVWRSG